MQTILAVQPDAECECRQRQTQTCDHMETKQDVVLEQQQQIVQRREQICRRYFQHFRAHCGIPCIQQPVRVFDNVKDTSVQADQLFAFPIQQCMVTERIDLHHQHQQCKYHSCHESSDHC